MGTRVGWRAKHKLFPVGRASFKRSLPLMMLGSIALAVGTTALGSYWFVRELILTDLKNNAFGQVQLSKAYLDDWLSAMQAKVGTIAQTPAVRSMNWDMAEPHLQLELNRLPDFYLFSYVFADGSYYTTEHSRLKAPANLRDRKHFQLAMQGKLHVSDPLVSRATGIRQINISAPIWSAPPLYRALDEDQLAIRARNLAEIGVKGDPSEPAKPIGELVGAIPSSKVVDIVNKTRHGKGSYAFALDSEGKVIAHPNLKLVEQAANFMADPNPALSKLASLMVNRQQGIDLFRLNGQAVYVAYVPLEQADWSLAIVIPKENFESQLGALNLLAAVFGVLLVAATISALRQLQLFDQAREHATREALLNRLTGQICASLDLHTILQTTVDEIAREIQADRIHFCWYRPDDHTLEVVCEHHSFYAMAQLGNYSLQAFPGLEASLQRAHPVRWSPVERLDEVERSIRAFYQQWGAVSYLVLPVLGQDSRVGYLACLRSQAMDWSRRDVELLRAITDQLAIALQQSALHTQTQVQAALAQAQTEQLSETLTQLKQTQTQLVQSEKMSSLGQLVAGIAHEINNPVNFIYGNLTHANTYTQELINLIQLYQEHYPQPLKAIQTRIEDIDLDFIQTDLPKTLESMHVGAERIREIVRSLRTFSRLDEADLKQVDLHEGIDSTLMILRSRLKETSKHPAIQVIKEYSDLPLVCCYAGQLNQVFMNVISNAIDALEQAREQDDNPLTDPTIWIRTQVLEPGWVQVAIADNGPGIPSEVQQRLFDPFFTTKPVGKGTGMGLSISYQIVTERHQGRFYCQSEVGKGAEFRVEIPIGEATLVEPSLPTAC